MIKKADKRDLEIYQRLRSLNSVITEEMKRIEDLYFSKILSLPVYELELSTRAMNCLKNEDIQYIGELIQQTNRQMLRMPNFGKKSLKQLKDALQGTTVNNYDLKPWNLSLGMSGFIFNKKNLKEDFNAG
jgi:DNA-directed RNA polymerase subunit alpha